jgi:mannose-6-phosphate isomerase-like protein (cupin superfamily)
MIHYETGSSDTRPWGNWLVLACGFGFVIKEIIVTPGQILSLQSHEKRSEHWVIISGRAEVTLHRDVKQCFPNDTVFIPALAKHRIKNCGDIDLRFIEIQVGEVLSEDDIERYEDRYGRAKGVEL